MSRFPDADHLTSWAGLAPGSNESAGKRKRAKTRKGSPGLRAAVAVARKLLVILYHILSTHEPYRELGADYHQRRTAQALQRRAVRQLESLGYTVTLEPTEAAA